MSDRRVFPYTQGGQELFADPYAVQRSLNRALGGDPNATLEDAQYRLTKADGTPAGEGEKGVEQPPDRLRRLGAEERLCGAARLAFGLPEFDVKTGQGATDDEALGLLYRFLEWQEKNDSPAATTATS